MKDLLELLGAEVAGPAATMAEADHLLSANTPDVALVDFHLRDGELSTGLIARLHEKYPSRLDLRFRVFSSAIREYRDHS